MRIYYQILAFIVICFTACQEETVNKQTDVLQQRVFTSLNKEENLANALDNLSLTAINGRVKSSLTQFKQDSIMKVLQLDSISYSYTFASNEIFSGKTFKNLVIRQVKGGYLGFILEYVPDDIKSLFDIEHFTGTVRRYDLGNNLLIEIKLSKGLLVTGIANGRVNSCENAFQIRNESFNGSIWTECIDLWNGNSDGCEPYIYITSCGGDAASGDSNFWTPPNIDEGTYFSGGTNTNGSGGGLGNSAIYPETTRVLATQVPSLTGEAFANYVALEAWENEQILDAQLKPCMQTILGSIKRLSNGSVGQVIQKFSGTAPGYNWEVKDGVLVGGQNAFTNQIYNKTTGTVTTTFDGSKFTNSSDLSIARTILHESIHASLVAHFKIDPLGAVKSYPDLVSDWAKGIYGDQNTNQHAEFVRNFINDLAIALEEYGIAKGYNLSNQFYKDLAWGGLTHTGKLDSAGMPIETPWFQSSFPNSSDRQRIIDVITIEQTGKDFYGNSKTKNGRNAGC